MSAVSERMKSMRQIVMLIGTLETLEPNTHRFTLRLDAEQRIPCLWIEGNLARLAPLLGQRVLVSGMGVWQLSGKLERIEVDRIRLGEGESDIFKWLPVPHFTWDVPPEELTPQPWGPETIVGKWPGEETDEQIEEALKRIS